MFFSEEETKLCELPELNGNEIYISHVGDGEYEFNVFGSAHLDQMKLFNAFANLLNISVLDIIVFKHFNAWTQKESDGYYFGIKQVVINARKFSHIYYDVIAYITIEKIDPEILSKDIL